MMGVMRREALLKTRLMATYVASEVVFVLEMRLQGELWQVPEELHYQRLPDEENKHRVVRKSHRGEAIFLDPLNAARKFLMPPGIKLLVEMFRGVWRAPISAGRKARAYREVVEHVLEKFRRVVHPKALSRYVKQNLHWATETLTESDREHAQGHLVHASKRTHGREEART